MKVAYVTNASPQSGVGKPAREILRHLQKQNQFSLTNFHIDAAACQLLQNEKVEARISAWPGPLSAKPFQWVRLSRKLPQAKFDVWHFTNQTLSFIPRQPAIVTVFDLIELLEPQEKFGRPVAKRLYSGIPKAAHLICVSQYTKKTVQEKYGISDERITVIPLAAAKTFQPDTGVKNTVGYHEALHKLELTPQHRIILYVGSEHPRKNVPVLVEAFARVHKEMPETILLKVGDPGFAEGRKKLLKQIDELDIRSTVKLYGNADDETLKLLYNLADVFVFPTTFEGFGIPPLEAMACGCPVVSSNVTSLPEVVGDAALTCYPTDVVGFADAIQRVLTDSKLAQDLRSRGLAQAAKFSWETSAQKTLQVYRLVSDA